LIFETVGGFRLIGSVDHPVVHSKAIADRITGTESHVVEGEKAEPVGSGIVHLILGVIAFDPKRTPPLTEVDVHALTNRNDVGTVSLKNVAIDVRAWFVGRVSLRRVRGLAEL